MHVRVRHFGGLVAGIVLVGCTESSSGPPLAAPEEPSAASLAFSSLEPGDPVPGLTAAELHAFDEGEEVFEDRVFTEAEGLGPLFNAASCGECHLEPTPGPQLETHFSNALIDGTCDLMELQGGNVLQTFTTSLLQGLGYLTEPASLDLHQRGVRSTPDVFGFGLIEEIPDRLLLAIADPNDRNRDGISGRAHLVNGRVGRFGRKASVASLDDFNAGAFLQEMGITSPAHPVENQLGPLPMPAGMDPAPDPELSQEDLDFANAYVRFLAPPAPLRLDPEGRIGGLIFAATGCAACHVPTLITGFAKSAALRFKRVDLFSDLLLHDMGPDLADNCQGGAGASEFRTEPLMGLRFMTQFMHDGRASSIDEAVLLHGGEAQRVRDRYASLTVLQKRALMTYLNSI